MEPSTLEDARQQLKKARKELHQAHMQITEMAALLDAVEAQANRRKERQAKRDERQIIKRVKYEENMQKQKFASEPPLSMHSTPYSPPNLTGIADLSVPAAVSIECVKMEIGTQTNDNLIQINSKNNHTVGEINCGKINGFKNNCGQTTDLIDTVSNVSVKLELEKEKQFLYQQQLRIIMQDSLREAEQNLNFKPCGNPKLNPENGLLVINHEWQNITPILKIPAVDKKEVTVMKIEASMTQISSEHRDGQIICTTGTLALKAIRDHPETARIVMYDDMTDEKILNLEAPISRRLRIITSDKSNIRFCLVEAQDLTVGTRFSQPRSNGFNRTGICNTSEALLLTPDFASTQQSVVAKPHANNGPNTSAGSWSIIGSIDWCASIRRSDRSNLRRAYGGCVAGTGIARGEIRHRKQKKFRNTVNTKSSANAIILRRFRAMTKITLAYLGVHRALKAPTSTTRIRQRMISAVASAMITIRMAKAVGRKQHCDLFWTPKIESIQIPPQPPPPLTSSPSPSIPTPTLSSCVAYSLDLEPHLFIEAVKNSLERLLAKVGVLRLRNEFLFTSYFFGDQEIERSKLSMVSAVPKVSFVGTSLLIQLKIWRHNHESLDLGHLHACEKADVDVVLLPFGVSAKLLGASSHHQKDAFKSDPALWTRNFGFPESFIEQAAANYEFNRNINIRPSDYTTVEVDIENEERMVLSFPSALIVVPINNSENYDSYFDEFRNWRWSIEVASMFNALNSQCIPISQSTRAANGITEVGEKSVSKASKVGDSVDYWRYINPYYRLIDLNLADAGHLEQIIRSKELQDIKALEQQKLLSQREQNEKLQKRKRSKLIFHNSGASVASTPPLIVPSLSANETKGQSSLKGMNTETDLNLGNLNNGRHTTDLTGLQLDDIGDDDWGFFETPAPAPKSSATAIPGTSITVTAAASPAFSLPACSPAAFTPGATTGLAGLSPVPFTPNYSLNHAVPSSSMTIVQPTPDPTTPGVFGASSTGSEDVAMPDAANNQDLDSTLADANDSMKIFNVMSLLRENNRVSSFDESDDESTALPDRWKCLNLDFNVVWEETNPSMLRKYGSDIGAKYIYKVQEERKRRISCVSVIDDSGLKHVKINLRDESESDNESDSNSSSSGNASELCESIKMGGKMGKQAGEKYDEEEEVLEAGEILNVYGENEHIQALSWTPRTDEEFLLSRQIMVDEMTVGRGYLWMNFSKARFFFSNKSSKSTNFAPAFESRMIHVFNSALSEIFHSGVGGVAFIDQNVVRGPLTIENMFDYNAEPDKGTSKYGKFQLKKKKRPEPVLDTLKPPQVFVSHNNVPLNINYNAVKFWDKLSLAPSCGTKNVEYVTICPVSHQSSTSNAKRWFGELSNIWDFHNFGEFKPLRDLSGGEQDPGFCYVNIAHCVGSSGTENRDDLRKRCFVDSVDILCEHFIDIRNEKKKTNEIAKLLTARHNSRTKSSHIVVFLLNPFPQIRQSLSEMHYLSARLLQNVSQASNFSLKAIANRIVVPVVVPINFVLPQLKETRAMFDIKEFAFGLFSRCRFFDFNDTYASNIISNPYILAKSSNTAPGLMLNRPLDNPLCAVVDPDRIMHITFNVSDYEKRLGICWCDSIGEFVECSVLPVDSSNDKWFLKSLAHLWEKTVAFLGLKNKTTICWRFVFSNCGSYTLAQNEDVAHFLDYLSVEISEKYLHSVSSISFVSLNLNPALTILDIGAVNGKSGGGLSQILLGNTADATVEKSKKEASFDGEFDTSKNQERLISDGPASYLFLMKNHRLPIGNPVELSVEPLSEHKLHIYTHYSDLEASSMFLPLAGSYLIDVPRRETAPPIPVSVVSNLPLLPSEGSKSVSVFEGSLLHHQNISQTKATLYSGWNSQPIKFAQFKPGLEHESYTSPSSLTSTPAAYPLASNANTPVLVPASIKMSSPTLPTSAQHAASVLPSTPQPSTPFQNTGAFSGTNAPQQQHINVLRDIMKDYHALRFVHRGPTFDGATTGGLPWMFEMARVASECG
ncbi:mediator of RNA polymerase II transcription subunit 13 [Physocladia obscura]|uniref:Mediator of RNA polymerase II transcription subunit 13 n=1 Tax=Physocladia obscura TaxID=109957 RepID=A0AAD5XKR1_9FUNG|nr:mediator of RNA polymerase II transcription subunit 13 [Physocladia obscura]